MLTADDGLLAQKTRPSAVQVAAALVALYERPFGRSERGRFRISRKLLRQIAGRQRLAPEFLIEIGEELFEADFIFVDMESYFIVLEQRLFRSYRRVPAIAIGFANAAAIDRSKGSE